MGAAASSSSSSSSSSSRSQQFQDDGINYYENQPIDIKDRPKVGDLGHTGFITFVRHSYSCADAAKSINYFLRDPELTSGGIDEARKICKKHQWLSPGSFDNKKSWLIFSSELTRSIETALQIMLCIRYDDKYQPACTDKTDRKENQLCLTKLDQSVIVAPFLNEIDKYFQTLNNKPRSQSNLWGSDVIWKITDKNRNVKPSLKKFIKWLNYNYPTWQEYNVVVVTHSSLIKRDTGYKLDNLGTLTAQVKVQNGKVNNITYEDNNQWKGLSTDIFRRHKKGYRCKRGAIRDARSDFETDSETDSETDLETDSETISEDTDDTSPDKYLKYVVSDLDARRNVENRIKIYQKAKKGKTASSSHNDSSSSSSGSGSGSDR